MEIKRFDDDKTFKFICVGMDEEDYEIDGRELFEIISVYFNTIEKNNTGWIKFKDKGAMVNKDHFDRLMREEMFPCDKMRGKYLEAAGIISTIKSAVDNFKLT